MEGYLVDGFRLHQPVNCPDQLYTVRKFSLIRKKSFVQSSSIERKLSLINSELCSIPLPLQVMVSCWAGRAQHRAAIPALYSHLKQFSAQLQQFVWVQQQTMFSARTTKVWPRQLDPTTLICFHLRQLKSQFHQMFGLFSSSDSWSGALKNSHKFWSKCANRVLYISNIYNSCVWEVEAKSSVPHQVTRHFPEALYMINYSNKLNLGLIETALPKISKTFMLT